MSEQVTPKRPGFATRKWHSLYRGRVTRTASQSPEPDASGKVTQAATRTPSFMKLIKELRSRFPIERQIKSNLVICDEEDGICHETGERLSHIDIGRTRSTMLKQKGVSFSPETLAVSAVVENSAVELDELLSNGSISVDQADTHGDTLLHKAALEGDVDCIRVLVKHGANVNIRNKDNWPPVHNALRQGNLSAMVYLIECGADMEEYTKLRVNEFKVTEELSKTVYKGEEIFV